MSRGDGFATADLDVNFFRDLKVKRLAREFPDLFLVASLGYLGMVAHCWGCGERQTALDAWPDLVPWSEEAVAALEAVSLLDRTSRVAKKTWDQWFGVAFARRELRRSAGSVGGKQRASNATAKLEHSPSNVQPVPSVPFLPSDSPKSPQVGTSVKPRRKNGDTPRAKGRSPRQLRDGSPEVDAKALAELGERTAKWNADHPTDPIDTSFIGGRS